MIMANITPWRGRREVGRFRNEMDRLFDDFFARSPLGRSFDGSDWTLLSLLAQSRLYAGHDSGITHLAAMLGTPTLAFFRSTSAIQWRPLGPKVGIIQRQEGDQSVLEEALAQAHELMREAD
jgi:hypothetical protein